MKTVRVVAAVIKAVNENGEPIIFATQRGYGEFKDGWEFPGGKIEEGETPQDALRAIAKKAMEKDTGARALRAIIEEFMLDIMYEIPKDDSIGQVTITQEYIENTGGPIITLRGQEVPRLESQA